jgi:hypothetical protein
MNLLQKHDFKLEGKVVYDYLVGTYNEHELKEGIEVVVSTKDMPRDHMIEAQVWSWFMNTFHINGITNYISRVLYKLKGIEYSTFYNALYAYIQKDEWLLSEIKRIEEHYAKWTEDGRIDHTPIQGMEIHGWNLIHSTVINLHSENKHSHIFRVIDNFLLDCFEIEPTLHKELIKFQRNFLVDYNDIKQYPKVLEFEYDIPGYVQDTNKLHEKSSYEFDFPEDKNQSLQRFCEQIFFARRRNFGKAWLTRKV